MSWKSRRPCAVVGVPPEARRAADAVEAACFAFAEYDYLKGAALIAASAAGFACLGHAFRKDDKACTGCGHHVCSCGQEDGLCSG